MFGGKQKVDIIDMSLWDVKKEARDEGYVGQKLIDVFAALPRGDVRLAVAGKMMDPVTTGQIYWGAVPFVVIQMIMVGLVIAFPQMVMHYKSTGVVVDQKKAMEQLQNLPGLGAPMPMMDFNTMPGLPGVPKK